MTDPNHTMDARRTARAEADKALDAFAPMLSAARPLVQMQIATMRAWAGALENLASSLETKI